eukprot:scaffold3331_cov106-Skeletonema_dohrnii-CCMP3373.AAC.1
MTMTMILLLVLVHYWLAPCSLLAFLLVYVLWRASNGCKIAVSRSGSGVEIESSRAAVACVPWSDGTRSARYSRCESSKESKMVQCDKIDTALRQLHVVIRHFFRCVQNCLTK